ncbi:hypothetical protein [Bosea sp. CS1GBMeth4]|uniref:hypothetical protein n=1 Tax=Bosea sp. CS1GBMeth4 TaxID=1892849 RepID=UPI0016472B5A|nr:hypothetical protein [Bosea sp. CS1GBMeth4]
MAGPERGRFFMADRVACRRRGIAGIDGDVEGGKVSFRPVADVAQTRQNCVWIKRELNHTMTDKNHRRTNKPPVNQRHCPEEYRNGRAPASGKDTSSSHIGKTDYLDKSQSSWTGEAPLSGKRFCAHVSNDFTDGHRGMARAVAGAQKYVRSRIRFHENAEVKRLAKGIISDE